MKLPNIVVRILVGAIFVSLLVGGILFNEYTFGLLFSLITGLALYEFYGLIEKDAKTPVSKWFNILGGILLFACGWFYCSAANCMFFLGVEVFFPYLIFLIVMFVSELYLKREDPIKSLAYSLLGQIYIALPFTLTNFLAFNYGVGIGSGYYSFIFILAVLVFIWVNDSFAYLTGMAFGKRRLFERISPKKSWEGFIGGAIFSMASSYLFYRFGDTGNSLFFWIGFALVTVVFGTWGDLIESLMKRTLGVKDSGIMIPGHGGILDRFDSTIFAIPAIAIYVSIFS